MTAVKDSAEIPVSLRRSGHAAQPKSGGETLATPSNDAYLEIMKVHSPLPAYYLHRTQLVGS